MLICLQQRWGCRALLLLATSYAIVIRQICFDVPEEMHGQR